VDLSRCRKQDSAKQNIRDESGGGRNVAADAVFLKPL